MGMRKHRFVGLDKDVWLPDNIVVEIAIVPASMRNIRSNEYFVGQTSYTQHETANFNYGANADMHRRWLHGGAGGAYVGFNFVVDDKKIIQLTPLNEVTWAAGTPDGNRYSWHTELCVNSDINHTVARRNAAALAGGILAAKGWGTDRLYQHNIWWGKDCPYLLRRDGRWPVFVAQVGGFINEAKTGGVVVPAQPALNIVAGETLIVKEPTLVRQGYASTYKEVATLPVGTQVKVGKDGDGNFWIANDGRSWVNISGAFGSGWAETNGLQKYEASTPVPAPAPKPEIFDGTKNITINGVVFNAGKRTVTSIGVNEREWASTDSPVRKLHLYGARVPVLGWIKGADVGGENRWWVTHPDGGRIWVGGTTEKP